MKFKRERKNAYQKAMKHWLEGVAMDNDDGVQSKWDLVWLTVIALLIFAAMIAVGYGLVHFAAWMGWIM